MTLIGSNHPGRVAFEAALGIPMDYVRCFNENDAQTHANANRAVIVTTKPSFSDSASSRDTKLKALANKYAAFPKPGFFGGWHEPENDIDAGDFSRQQYIDMQKAINDVMGPILRPLGWEMIQIFMGFHFPGGTGGSWDIKPLILATTETLGADTYVWRGANQGCAPWACATNAPKNEFNISYAPALDYGTSLGKKVILCEFGITARQSDTSFSEVTQLMAWFVAWHAARPANSKYTAVVYFWQGPPQFPPEWRHVNAAGLQEFKKLRTGVVVPPVDPPGETDAQKITRLTAELATAKTDLATAKAISAAAVAENAALITQRDGLQIKIDKAKTDLA